VVRPQGITHPLPVLVWIYGGGLYAGSTADPQYNLSGIVRTSQDMSRPVIAVPMNYRLGVWGFLQTPQILAEGSSNAGLLDQKLALQWIKENIRAFGGDPKQVTVWGESAGAQSIALHLHSNGGRDDSLFQSAILESGGPIGAALQPLAYYSSPVENLTRTVGCWTASDQLACLRSISSETLYAAHTSQTWNPLVDGDFLTAYPSQLMEQGNHIRVPLLIGTNTDEGVSFGSNFAHADNDTALFNALLPYRSYSLSPPNIHKLFELYPNDPANSPPYHIKTNLTPAGYASEYRRGAAIAGDLVMIAQRRKTCAEFAASGQDVFSYRFDTPAWNASIWTGIPHFVNVMFSFQNISGALGPLPQFESYRILSRQIGQAYINFVYDHDPNGKRATSSSVDKTAALPVWPKWNQQKVNMVLNANGSFVENDDFRQRGIDFINTIDRELLA
jgi:carboxylesterase type B